MNILIAMFKSFHQVCVSLKLYMTVGWTSNFHRMLCSWGHNMWFHR